jgi:hypothetical protein
LYVIARERRRASRSASASLAYSHWRIPPSDGPSVVSWMAMIARRPLAGSLQMTTCSCPWSTICSRNEGGTREH